MIKRNVETATFEELMKKFEQNKVMKDFLLLDWVIMVDFIIFVSWYFSK